MIRRGASFPGRARERMAGVGEAVTLFARLNRNESRIIHNAGGPLREKASSERVEAIARIEWETASLLRTVVQDGVDDGDLELASSTTVERITFAIASLVDGGFALLENGIPQNVLGLARPGHELWHAYNTLADAYSWQPLSSEVDWEEILAKIRQDIFPEEAQRLYGNECWYGDHGRVHPKKQRSEKRANAAAS